MDEMVSRDSQRDSADSQRGPADSSRADAGQASKGSSVVKKISYTHDGMIDLIVENPGISQGALARHFGYTEAWVSQVINSDNFRERLAERKEEVVDPVLRMTMEERIRGLVDKSVQVLLQKLAENPNASIAVKALDVGSRALGYGARDSRANVTQNNYIALVPPVSRNATEWANIYNPDTAVKALIDGNVTE